MPGGVGKAGSACAWPRAARVCPALVWSELLGWGHGELSGLAGAVLAPLATPPCCASPEKSRRASILGPMGIATLQPNGSDPEARLPHIQDTAARLLSPDEVTAVLRHCSRVGSKGRAQAGQHCHPGLVPGKLLHPKGMALCPCLTRGGKPRNW